MAKLKIYSFPDEILTKVAAPIERVEKSYFQLADDMLETMYDAPGIGLAANQVGVLDRILVIDTEYVMDDVTDETDLANLPDGAEVVGDAIVSGKKPIIVINPEIIYKEGEIKFQEGCLSVPEYSAEVRRAEKIKLQYQNIDGLTKELSADGLLAVCIQHEMDHLDGKLFIDRLSPMKKQMAQKKLLRARKSKEDK